MRLRSCKIAVIAAVFCLLNLHRLISQVTLKNLMFLHERMMENFVQESESLLFLATVLLSVTEDNVIFDAQTEERGHGQDCRTGLM